MRGILHIALTATFAFSAFSAAAQTHPNMNTEGKINTIVGIGGVSLNDSVDVYRQLIDNAPIEPEFRSIPRFAIIGKDRKFYFSVGANLKFTASYDWGNPVHDPGGLAPNAIRPADPGDHQLLQMSAQSSNIYFNIIGFPESANRVGLFISLSMDGEPGNSYKIHAGQVYLRYRHFQCGYTSSLYNDKAADPYLIDGHGPCSSGAHDDIQVNFQHYVARNWRLGVSVELPSVSYTPYQPQNPSEEIDYTSVINQTIPTIPVYIGYNWGGKNHVRLSAVMRNMRYRDHVENRTRVSTGLGLKLSSAFVLGPTTTYLMAQGGKGVASFIQENRGLGLDMVPSSEPGRLTNTSSWGFMGAFQYNFTPNLFATALYSYMRNYVPEYRNAATIPYEEQMKRSQYAAANVVWQMSSLFRCGVEYVYASKTDFTRRTLADNRLIAMLMMTF